MSWDGNEIVDIKSENTSGISQCCCVASNEEHLFVGTLKPSFIQMNVDTFSPEQEFHLYPIRYQTANKKNRYPWLQDMKAVRNHMYCLFTGTPYPLQMFTLMGEFVSGIIAEDQIAGAYSFNTHIHPLTTELSFYICDFWGNDVKQFDHNGRYIETVREKGNQLGQVIRPTAIFIESSGYITVSDLKEDNCLQRL